jgi:hypothetical protein
MSGRARTIDPFGSRKVRDPSIVSSKNSPPARVRNRDVHARVACAE